MADIVNFDYGKFKIPKNWRQMLKQTTCKRLWHALKDEDIFVGAKIKDLTVLSIDHKTVSVKCACGMTFNVKMSWLTTGRKERCAECSARHKSKIRKKPLRSFNIDALCRYVFYAWRNMFTRTKHVESYQRNKIEVCQEWQDYFNFVKFASEFTDENGIDFAVAYCKNMSVDRIDNFGDYRPENIRFATDEMQANNKSNNIRIPNEFDELESITHFSRRHQIPRKIVDERAKNGTFDAKSIINEYRTDGEQMMLFEPDTNHRAKSARSRR